MKATTQKFYKAAALILAAAMGFSFAGCSSDAKVLVEGSAQTGTGSVSVSESDAEAALMDFSLDFMNAAISLSEDENLVLSPASAYLALTLLACGSNGETADELSATLRIPDGQWTDYGKVSRSLVNVSDGTTVLKSADSVWIDSDGGYEAKQDYLDAVGGELGADVYETDLQDDSVVDLVNDWVSSATEEMIETLREAPYDSFVKAALLNALYFEAKWESEFAAEMTDEKDFTTSGGEIVSVDFLRDYGCYRHYVNHDNIEGIMLPYMDGDIAFLAIRPTDKSDPKALLEDMTPELLRELVDIDDTTYMNFSMPKFDVSYRQDLNDTFADIGLEKTINDCADLSGMFSNPDASEMTVEAVQVVRVQVDEEGTKAAAVTEITTAETAAEETPDPIELHLDSPFLYTIVDTSSGVPLFMGIMENPG